jgi:predicted amidohydrolase
VKVACIQLSSNADLDRNLRVAGELVAEAAAAGARLAVLPEVFNRRGSKELQLAHQEELTGATAAWMKRVALEHKLWLLAGSFMEKRSEHAPRGSNSSLLIAPDGQPVAHYRKIHLFDVEVHGVSTRESDAMVPGESPVLTAVDDVPVGMTICYDLRFPELYRALTLAGARVIVVPAAFTERTGRDHWEILLRARAIENQVFVLAPNQLGPAEGTQTCYGRSLIIDPWGVVLAQAPDTECCIVASLDFAAQDRVRAGLPCLQHRRESAYVLRG